MHRATCIVLVMLAAGALSAPALPAQERDATAFHWEGEIPAGSWIRVRNLSGQIRVEPSDDDRVEVRGEKFWRRGHPSDVHFEVVRDGSSVTVCALWYENSYCDADAYHSHGGTHHDNDVTVDFTVRLPRDVKVLAATVNGSVEIRGARAAVVAETVNGRIEATTSAGPVDATTVNGNVRVRMESVAGAGNMDFSTVNGSVTVEAPSSLDGDVEMETVNGSLVSDYPLTLRGRFSPKHLRATIGRGGRRIRLTTVNGSVELRKL